MPVDPPGRQNFPHKKFRQGPMLAVGGLRCFTPFSPLFFCSGSGSLARVTPLFHAVIGFRVVLFFYDESPMGWVATLRQTKSLDVFSSVTYRVTLATGVDTVVKPGGTPPPAEA